MSCNDSIAQISRIESRDNREALCRLLSDSHVARRDRDDLIGIASGAMPEARMKRPKDGSADLRRCRRTRRSAMWRRGAVKRNTKPSNSSGVGRAVRLWSSKPATRVRLSHSAPSYIAGSPTGRGEPTVNRIALGSSPSPAAKFRGISKACLNALPCHGRDRGLKSRMPRQFARAVGTGPAPTKPAD